MRNLAVALIVFAASTAADAKPKPSESAKVHIDRAEKAHKAGKFDVALTELKTAYELDPQPKLLFAIAQVYAKLDRCAEAIDYYEKFDAAAKDESKHAVAQQAIEACRKRLADKPDKPEKPDPGVFRAKKPTEEQPTSEPKQIEAASETRPAETQAAAQKPVEDVPEAKPETKPAEIRPFDEPPPVKPVPVATAPIASVTAQTSAKPWYRDPIGDALVVGGVGAIIGSVFTYRGAQSDLDSAEHAPSLDSYNDHRDSAERKQMLTAVLAGGGLTLVVAGVLRFALRDNGNESRGVALVPTERGGFITWSGGF